jgi:hypothetical protein
MGTRMEARLSDWRRSTRRLLDRVELVELAMLRAQGAYTSFDSWATQIMWDCVKEDLPRPKRAWRQVLYATTLYSNKFRQVHAEK